jgi:hypothetical protein
MRHDFNAALNAVAEKPITDKSLKVLPCVAVSMPSIASRIARSARRTSRAIKRSARRTLRSGREAAGRDCRGSSLDRNAKSVFQELLDANRSRRENPLP